MTLMMIPQQEWLTFKNLQQEILEKLNKIQVGKNASLNGYANFLTAKEFMEVVKIKRTKFDQLVQTNKIRIIKKKRKIYVSTKEVERYFTDHSIQ